jgi:hypothetical protein
MKKRQVFIVLTTLFIIFAGLGAIFTVRTALANRTPSGNAQSLLYITGTQSIPTVAVSNSTANCDPSNIPTPDSASTSAEGNVAPTIKPHLCGIPTFTEQDVRQYMSTVSSFTGRRIRQLSPHFIVTRILFVTNEVANDILNADTGISSNTLIVCYVEVYGDFTVEAPFATTKKPLLLHHGEMVFDGVTGNELGMGVRP